MKFVTREHAKVDRIACPWLIHRFVDENAEFLFVPATGLTDAQSGPVYDALYEYYRGHIAAGN